VATSHRSLARVSPTAVDRSSDLIAGMPGLRGTWTPSDTARTRVVEEVVVMGGRWRCWLTGSHLWTKREADQGPSFECARCHRIQWLPDDDTGVDPANVPWGPGGGGGG
jgi:hypothetical protein